MKPGSRLNDQANIYLPDTGGDGGDLFVVLGEVGDGASEDLRVGRVAAAVGGAVLDVVGAEAVELAGFVEGRLVPAPLLGDDVEDHRLVLALQVVEGLDEERQVVAVEGTEVAQPDANTTAAMTIR